MANPYPISPFLPGYTTDSTAVIDIRNAVANMVLPRSFLGPFVEDACEFNVIFSLEMDAYWFAANND